MCERQETCHFGVESHRPSDPSIGASHLYDLASKSSSTSLTNHVHDTMQRHSRDALAPAHSRLRPLTTVSRHPFVSLSRNPHPPTSRVNGRRHTYSTAGAAGTAENPRQSRARSYTHTFQRLPSAHLRLTNRSSRAIPHTAPFSHRLETPLAALNQPSVYGTPQCK